MISFAELPYLSSRVGRLLSLPKGAVGRKLRRFLDEVCLELAPGEKHLWLAFAQFCDGYTAEQLNALHAVARTVLEKANKAFAEMPLAQGRVVFDIEFGTVGLIFPLKVGASQTSSVQKASVAEMRTLLNAVVWLLEQTQAHLKPGYQTGLEACPDYVYRGLPCSVVSDAELWAVSGHDTRGMSGVLEWCVSESDAQERLAMMKSQPSRFTSLKAAPFSESFRPSSSHALA